MLNRDIYLKDPTTIKLVNEGVANVNDEQTSQALSVLRYEVETFVCDGEYEKGMNRILETYLKNINQAQQPSVWISGFYGSGKSHLAKMLRALWVDTLFEDGATARGIANLPDTTKDLFKELSTQGKRHGGLHAVSGTLGSGLSANVRLALLGIIFKSCGLPEQFQKARFVIWLKQEKLYEPLKEYVQNQGADWQEEIDNFYVAEILHEGLIKLKPNVFISHEICMEALNNLYPNTEDISIDDMIKLIKQALTKDGIFPLTVLILDEMQQYIGDDSKRSEDVRETIEACAKKIGGKIIIVSTGQTAITGTPNLKKLEGRFTVRVELSDNDVDTVIRKVFLAKKPNAKESLENLRKTNMGEISRHLSETSIGHRVEDNDVFIQDYPILPVRRRFWEETLRALDQTGTESQLRNQLSTVHKAIQTNVDKSLGNVIPADYLYFDSADKLLQARLLPRIIYERTMTLIKEDDEDKRLTARACGLIFLINKLNVHNKDIGIRAVSDTIADLMLTDITSDSGNLRSKLSGLLDNCKLIMKVGDEYRIQTEESVAWNNEFQNQKHSLASSSQLIDSEREERLKQYYKDINKRMNITQGKSKVPREIHPHYGSSIPQDHKEKIYIWLRTGWSIEENSAIVDAKQLGNDSPLITLYIPKKNADAIRSNLIDYMAAKTTLNLRGNPLNSEGVEAKSSIETIKSKAENKLNVLFKELFEEAKVVQAGGSHFSSNSLQESLNIAIDNSMIRLFPQFSTADDIHWSKVYDKAKQGAPDALKSIGFEGDPPSNPVCKTVLSFIGNGKRGDEIRKHFDNPPYGWSRDAVDGAIQTMLIHGMIKALDDRNQVLDPKNIDRKTLGKINIRTESAVVTAEQKIKIRKLFQKLDISTKSGEELQNSNLFIDRLFDLAEKAGGDPPLPPNPDTSQIDEIRLVSGNERLIMIYNAAEDLTKKIDSWKQQAEKIAKFFPEWQDLNKLLKYSEGIPDKDIAASQIQHIEQKRTLLEDHDQVSQILKNLSQALRNELNNLKEEYELIYARELEDLSKDHYWQQLEAEQQEELLSSYQLFDASNLNISVQTTKSILDTLENVSITALKDRITALSAKFDSVRSEAAKILEPKSQVISLPKKTLKSTDDIDDWLNEIKTILKQAIEKGPVTIK